MKENVIFFIFCCVISKSDYRIRLNASFRVSKSCFSSGYGVFYHCFKFTSGFSSTSDYRSGLNLPSVHTSDVFLSHAKTVLLYLKSVARKVDFLFWRSKKVTFKLNFNSIQDGCQDFTLWRCVNRLVFLFWP